MSNEKKLCINCAHLRKIDDEIDQYFEQYCCSKSINPVDGTFLTCCCCRTPWRECKPEGILWEQK